jgi:hypothetical protein
VIRKELSFRIWRHFSLLLNFHVLSTVGEIPSGQVLGLAPSRRKSILHAYEASASQFYEEDPISMESLKT